MLVWVFKVLGLVFFGKNIREFTRTDADFFSGLFPKSKVQSPKCKVQSREVGKCEVCGEGWLEGAKFLGDDGEKQLLNYLRSTGKKVGLLLGFGKKADIKRKVF